MTPTEDHYADRTTSTKECEPGTCCVTSVKSLEESCRALAGSNAPKRHKALQTFLSSLALQGCQTRVCRGAEVSDTNLQTSL